MKLEGGVAIVKAATSNKPNLKTLEIGTNQFGESGVQELTELLQAEGKEDLLGEEGIEDDEGSSDEDDDDDEDDENGNYDDDEGEAEDEQEDDEEEQQNKSGKDVSNVTLVS